ETQVPKVPAGKFESKRIMLVPSNAVTFEVVNAPISQLIPVSQTQVSKALLNELFAAVFPRNSIFILQVIPPSPFSLKCWVGYSIPACAGVFICEYGIKRD